MKSQKLCTHYCASCTCKKILCESETVLLFFTVLCMYFLVHSAKSVSHGISTILLVKG